MALPWEPLHCNSGYFMMVDVSKCRNLIPKKYFETHDYVEGLATNKIYLPGTKNIPLDLAFVRWMGQENGVTMMPNCFFYNSESPYIAENYVRVAICKDIVSVGKVLERLRDIKIVK